MSTFLRCLPVLLLAAAPAQAASPPNVVYFLADDLGWADVGWHRDDKVCRDEGYTTHLLAKEAIRLINDHDGKKPLFLYVPFNAPHAPYQVPEKYTRGLDASLKGQRRQFAGMIAALDEAV